MRKIFLSLILFSAIAATAQDTLPQFAVNNRGNNRIVISWYNKYPFVRQISIQRSFDSLNNFKTILTVPDPMNRQNGYLDAKAANDQMFYRLYILIDGANFIVTKPMRAFTDSVLLRIVNKSLSDIPLTEDELAILKRIQNAGVFTEEKEILTEEKLKTTEAAAGYRIFTNREGNVSVRLSDADSKKYTIKFFEEDDTFLFELKDIKETVLILDKSNFFHAGWFKFEIYDDDKLVEKHKFYLAKDF